MMNLSDAALTALPEMTQAKNSDRFLDAKFYTDPGFIALEQQQIFRKTWLYAGHSQTLVQSGSAITVEVAGQSILISRPHKDANTLRAFYNVCSHRAAPLQIQAGTCSQRFICPYHGWVYNLDGQVMGTPQRKHFPKAFDAQHFPLKSVQIEQLGPFMFVCLDTTEYPDARVPPLLDYLGQAAATITAYPLSQMQQLTAQDAVVACNWKTFHDNSLCDYHVDIAHRQTLKETQGSVENYEYRFDQYVNCLATPVTKSWQIENQILEELPEASRASFFTFGIFPNLHIFVLPNGALYLERIDPLTVNTCRVRTEIYSIPDFSPSTAKLAEWYDLLLSEDIALVEGVQRGYASGIYTAGIANGLESRVLHQQALFRRFMATHVTL